MATTTEVARRYFEALAAHDIDAALECWAAGGVDRFVGQQELVAPDGVRQYFTELFAAFPDFHFEILDTTTYRNRSAVRWRARGTFAGPGRFQGFVANGARLELEGCDVVTVQDGKIQLNDAFVDSGAIARQLGFLPAVGSAGEARLSRLANLRTRIASLIQGGQPQPAAPGVWIIRGGFPARLMNVFLLEDDGGVTVFDCGIREMGPLVAAAGARLGGIKRVVLGHADADHRGAAPALGVPVYCHEVAGTVQEGDEIAGFRVIDLPGHAPGQIGLFRDSDRVALATDCFYVLDAQTGIKRPAQVPHPAFNVDTDQALESMRKLAALDPAEVWPGHLGPVTGDVRSKLERPGSPSA
ncbi:MAG: MBL fold metallo-hydrolase [Actinobacteria bacterium]|nr:MAG: MBL fold metallo-hydrolase [Actinomycetota bacterium]